MTTRLRRLGGPGRSPRRPGQRLRVGVLTTTALLVLAGVPGLAQANTGMGSSEARVVVQEAIAFIANGAGPAVVLERIDDVLKAPDKAGVDLARVEQAQALVAGLAAGATPTQVAAALRQARELLAGAVTPAAPGAGFATGIETGTTVVLDEFRPAWGVRDAGGAVLLGLALVSVLLGLVLARRLRPPDSVRELRRRSSGATPIGAA